MKTLFFCFSFATAFFLCGAMIPAQPERIDTSLQSERIKVLKYTLTLQVDVELWNFYSGIVRIEFQCIEETDVIFLSGKDLKLSDKPPHLAIQILSSDTRPHIEIVKKKYSGIDGDLFPVTFNRNLEKGGTYELRAGFHKPAPYTDGPVIRYVYNRENRAKALTMTRTGPTRAKEILYCFDDINLKAKFDVQITHTQESKSFSNMPSKTQLLGEGLAEDDFEESNSMSTFSFGFVVGEFESKEYKDNSSPTVIRVSSDRSVIEQMNFAGEMALKIFLFYSKHLKIKYAAEKLDIIALPEYDKIERENNGFISIGESFIIHPNPSVGISETSIVLCLCDAIVHQFIGLQTTTFQFNEYWLNKGLILFFQANCLKKMYPETGPKFWNSYIIKSFARVLDISAEKSRPMLVPVNRLRLDTLFSDTYLAEKGHHIVRMMNFVVGNTFQDKFIAFFKTHQFVSTHSEEVWKVFDPENDQGAQSSNAKPLKEIMNSWITKHGLPMVTVEKTRNRIKLSQERFVLLGDKYTHSDKSKHWVFPFSYTTKSEKNFNNVEIDHWLESEESSFKPKSAINTSDWIIYNGNLNVLCRINYEQKNWKSLQSALLEKSQFYTISPEARVRLILDMFALAENGTFKDSYNFPLKTIKYLEHEESHLVWIAAMHELNKIQLKLRRTAGLEVFKEYIKKILKLVFERKQFKSITQIPEDDDEKNFKKLIITSACTVGVGSCVEQCQTLFHKWMENVNNGDDENPIPFAIRDIVYCQAIKHGSRDEWNFLWGQHVNEEDILAKREIYEALGCTNNLDRLEYYMDYWVDKNKILARDFHAVFNSFFSSEAGYLRMKKVFIERMNVIMEKHNLQDGFGIIPYAVKILEVTNNRGDMADVIRWVEWNINRTAQNNMIIKQALDEGSKKTNKNILWLEKHLGTFSKIPF